MIKTYPAVLFVARHGRRLALALSALVALTGIALFALTGSFGLLLASALLSGVAWAGTRLAAELIEVIAETLLPR
jgi:hypothetical protein